MHNDTLTQHELIEELLFPVITPPKIDCSPDTSPHRSLFSHSQHSQTLDTKLRHLSALYTNSPSVPPQPPQKMYKKGKFKVQKSHLPKDFCISPC